MDAPPAHEARRGAWAHELCASDGAACVLLPSRVPRTVKLDWSVMRRFGRRILRWEINANVLVVGRLGPRVWCWYVAPKGEGYVYASGIGASKIEAQLAAEAAGGIHRGGTFTLPKSPNALPAGAPLPVFVGDV